LPERSGETLWWDLGRSLKGREVLKEEARSNRPREASSRKTLKFNRKVKNKKGRVKSNKPVQEEEKL